MTARRDAARSSHPRGNRGEGLKDEVYRQMFRLEASRPGAEISLAIALLRAWLAAGSAPEMRKSRAWLKKISPICLFMIEAAQQASCPGEKCTQ
jgi:hypothetical protein